MRQDARTLLERLSRKEFKYQEFADSFADMDLWPIFEALLKDERVVGVRSSSLREAEVEIRERRSSEDRRTTERRTENRRAEPAPKPGLFNRYAQPAPAAPDSGGKVVNIRQFLGRLSDKD